MRIYSEEKTQAKESPPPSRFKPLRPAPPDKSHLKNAGPSMLVSIAPSVASSVVVVPSASNGLNGHTNPSGAASTSRENLQNGVDQAQLQNRKRRSESIRAILEAQKRGGSEQNDSAASGSSTPFSDARSASSATSSRPSSDSAEFGTHLKLRPKTTASLTPIDPKGCAIYMEQITPVIAAEAIEPLIEPSKLVSRLKPGESAAAAKMVDSNSQDSIMEIEQIEAQLVEPQSSSRERAQLVKSTETPNKRDLTGAPKGVSSSKKETRSVTKNAHENGANGGPVSIENFSFKKMRLFDDKFEPSKPPQQNGGAEQQTTSNTNEQQSNEQPRTRLQSKGKKSTNVNSPQENERQSTHKSGEAAAEASPGRSEARTDKSSSIKGRYSHPHISRKSKHDSKRLSEGSVSSRGTKQSSKSPPDANVSKESKQAESREQHAHEDSPEPYVPYRVSDLPRNNEMSVLENVRRISCEKYRKLMNEESEQDKSQKAAKDGLMREALKLAYLNSLGFLDDSCFDFMGKSLLPLASIPGANLSAQKTKLNEMLVSQIDQQVVQNLTSSGLYSLVLQADVDFTIIYVFIRFIDNRSFVSSSNWRQQDATKSMSHQQTRLIKIISMASMHSARTFPNGSKGPIMNGSDNHTRWSKFLFDQIKANVLELFMLNKNNLMCISLDTRLMSLMNIPVFQSNVKARFHSSVLIIPNNLASNMLSKRLGEWSFGEDFSMVSYFETLRSLFFYLKLTKSPLLFKNDPLIVYDFENCNDQLDNEAISSFFESRNLMRLRESLESVYDKYSEIVIYLQARIKTTNVTNDEIVFGLHEKFDSIEYYFMTCLLCDYIKFAFDYQLNFMRYGSKRVQFYLPWNFIGSYLNNLLNVQLIDTAHEPIPGLAKRSRKIEPDELAQSRARNNTPSRERDSSLLTANKDNRKQPSAAGHASSNKVIVFEKDRIHQLNLVKRDFERTVGTIFDSCLNERFSVYIADKETSGSTHGIYSTLVKMFDITYNQIEKIELARNSHFANNGGDDDDDDNIINYNLSLKHSITSSELRNLLIFYDLTEVVSLHQVEQEYLRFWRLFFEKMPVDCKFEVDKELDACQLQQRLALEHGAVCLESPILKLQGSLRSYFSRFVWENSNQRVCAITSFLATIFLCLPPMIDFKELKYTPADPMVAAGSGAAMHEPISIYPSPVELRELERSLKIFNSFDSSAQFQTEQPKFEDLTLVNFDEIGI